MEIPFLLLSTFIPLILSPVAYIIGKRSGTQAVTWFSFIVLSISTALLLVPSISVYSGNTHTESFLWSQFGNFGLRLDGLSLPFALTIYVLCTILALYSKPYMIQKILEDKQEKSIISHHSKGSELHHDTFSPSSHSISIQTLTFEDKKHLNHEMGLYFALYLAFSMGMLGTVLATNLIEFYVFFELMLIPSFFLLAFYGYGAKRRISLMFFFWTHVGAVVLLLGLLAMGLFAGGFDFDTIKANFDKIPTGWLSLIVFALIVGLGVKLAVVLLHIWLPYAHAEAPTPISALLSPAMIGIGAYGMIRLWMELLMPSYSEYSFIIAIWGLVTMVYGGAMALMQDDIKKVLAYSSISQMGYILFGLGSESILGLTGATLLYISHGLGKAILFMMAGSVILQTGTRSMSNLGGLAGKMPYTAVAAMIGALTIMGIPPTSGFMSEWILFNGVLQNAVADENTARIIAFAIGILTTVLTSAYLLRLYKRVFFGSLPASLSSVKDASKYVTVTMAIFAALSLTIGVYPDVVISPIKNYYDNVFSNDMIPSPDRQVGNNETTIEHVSSHLYDFSGHHYIYGHAEVKRSLQFEEVI